MEQFEKEFNEDHPGEKSISVVGPLAESKWNSMSEDEKTPFIVKAAQLKEDFVKEKAKGKLSIEPTAQLKEDFVKEKAKGKLILEPEKAPIAARDDTYPGVPKQPPTAFFIFMEDFRKEFKEGHPDNKSVTIVAKEGGAKWNSMTDSEKAPFKAKAATKKAEYVIAMKHYKEEYGDAPKRPSSPWIHFLKKSRDKYKIQNPGKKADKAVTKQFGADWKLMSDSDKAEFEALVVTERADFKKKKEEFEAAAKEKFLQKLENAPEKEKVGCSYHKFDLNQPATEEDSASTGSQLD